MGDRAAFVLTDIYHHCFHPLAVEIRGIGLKFSDYYEEVGVRWLLRTDVG
ncbi:MAG: hypothetical protein DDT18_01649 [Actinobacteria bacterium]|nr:hypothetical protein [Actinomycetota bacterium]